MVERLQRKFLVAFAIETSLQKEALPSRVRLTEHTSSSIAYEVGP